MQPKNYPTEGVYLPETALEKLNSAGYAKTYEKGEIIHQAGDPANSICIVASGKVSGFTMNAAGKAGNAYFLEQGAAFGLGPLLTGRPRSHNCEAIETSTLIHVSRAEIMKLLDEDREFRHQIFNFICSRLSFAYEALDEERYRTLPQRLAKRLVEYSNENDEVLFTQQQLAEQVGVSRVALGNALKSLADKGFVKTAYRKIIIVSPRKLNNYAYS